MPLQQRVAQATVPLVIITQRTLHRHKTGDVTRLHKGHQREQPARRLVTFAITQTIFRDKSQTLSSHRPTNNKAAKLGKQLAATGKVITLAGEKFTSASTRNGLVLKFHGRVLQAANLTALREDTTSNH
eukprot:5593737-Amphidinium_carterae.1